MWLATKQAAAKDKLPADSVLHTELGTRDAILYRRLAEDFPSIKRGPEEPLTNHLQRLLDARERWRNRDTSIVDKRREDPRAKGTLGDETKAPWLELRNRESEESQQQPDESQTEIALKRSDLPSRDPGWYTSPETTSRGYGPPPLPQRTPGDSLRPTHAPGYAPDPQSMADWYKFLGDKGIFLDADGRRLPPRQPRQPIDNHDIWAEFTQPTEDEREHQILNDVLRHDLPEDLGGFGKSWKQRFKERFRSRKASAEVVEYIKYAVSDMDG